MINGKFALATAVSLNASFACKRSHQRETVQQCSNWQLARRQHLGRTLENVKEMVNAIHVLSSKKAHEGVIKQISTASYDVERILELWGSYLFVQCLWAHLVSFFEGWTGSPSVLDFLGSLVLS